MLNIHAIRERSSVNGPGTRTVVWFQGCDLACPGCWNPETHSYEAKNVYTMRELRDKLFDILPGADGLTLSGGEPMQQAQSLFILLFELHHKLPDLSVGMYTGYSRRELDEGRFKYADCGDYSALNRSLLWQAIESHLDFAVMGRYNQLKPVNQPLVTSANQELVLFSDRYKPEDFPPQQVEYEIEPSGLISISGFPVS